MKEYIITPVPKPRMTKSDKWKKRPAVMRYWKFKDEVKLAKVKLPKAGCQVIFFMPMPASWPEHKKLVYELRAHQQKPDVDNLLKGLMDAVYGDDSGVWDIHVTKLWGMVGKILIREDL